MVGSAILRNLQSQGYTNIVYATSSELNLMDQLAVNDFFVSHRPEYVFMAAAKVGGIIVLGAVSLALGYTAGKEYAELEWPLDILIAIIWVIFGINMIGTILKRRERHLYVSTSFVI